MEPTSTAISAVISVFDQIPNEVLFLVGQFLDRSELVSSIQVCRLWHLTLLPLLWTKIDLRQWHRPSFPLLPLLHPKHVLRVHKSVHHGSYTSSVVKSLLCHVRQLEWWNNSEMTKVHVRSRHGYIPTKFKSALSPSARAAEARGDRSIIEAQDWCFDGASYLDASDVLRMIPKRRLTHLLIEELPNLTSVSLRLGPFEDADMLRSLIHLPRSMRDLRLVSFCWGTPRVAIEDLFPLFSRLEELELKGYWFYYEPNHPWYLSGVSGSTSSTMTLRLPENQEQTGITTVTASSSGPSWKLKRLAVKVDGLLLTQHCPQLVEFNLDYDEPLERRLLMSTAAPSFKPLQACKDHLRVLNYSMMTISCPELQDFVDTWARFEHLTDLTYVVHDVDMMLFLCEQQNLHLTQHQFANNQGGGADTRSESYKEGDIDYPHVFLPHLQHLTIDYRQDGPGKEQSKMISHCLYWILMTRTKLLTFKAPRTPLDTRLIAPQGLLSVDPSCSSSSSGGGVSDGIGSRQRVPSTPPPLWPSTASLKERILNKNVTWFDDGSVGVDSVFLTPRPIRFWACTRIETLYIRVGTWRTDRWTPLYRQLAELSELKSLSLISYRLQKGADSGILQLADGLCEVDAPETKDPDDNDAVERLLKNLRRQEIGVDPAEFLSADPPPLIQGGSSGNGLHDMSRQPFKPKLTKLQYLDLRSDTVSGWSRDEIRRLLLLLPRLEQVRLQPLLSACFGDVEQWLHEFGGVQDQSAITPSSGGRRIPVQFL